MYEVRLEYQFRLTKSYLYATYEDAVKKEKELYEWLQQIDPLEKRYYSLHIVKRSLDTKSNQDDADNVKEELKKKVLRLYASATHYCVDQSLISLLTKDKNDLLKELAKERI